MTAAIKKHQLQVHTSQLPAATLETKGIHQLSVFNKGSTNARFGFHSVRKENEEWAQRIVYTHKQYLDVSKEHWQSCRR